MSGLFIQTIPASAGETPDASPIDRLRQVAVRLTTDVVQTFRENRIFGAVIHHGLLRGGGIARSEDGRHVLMAVGAYWLDDEDERYATPAEVLRRLAANGFGARPALRGNYLLALYDNETDRLVVENDRFGLIPLYYRLLPDRMVAASEIKYVAEHGDNAPDLTALAETLQYGYGVTQRTLVEGVFRLPANHRLIYGAGELSLGPLPDLAFSRDRPATDVSHRELTRLFERSVNRCRADTDEVSASLSGGLDSRLVVLAARKLGLRVHATSSGEPGSLECRIARRFAREIGIPHANHEVNGRALPDWFHRAVWVTEGRCPAGHMHFLDAMFAADFPCGPQLHGLVGDAVIGGNFERPHLQGADPEAIRQACLDSTRGFVYWPTGSRRSILCENLLRQTDAIRDSLAADLNARLGAAADYADFLRFRYQHRICSFTIPCLTSQVLPWTDIVTPYLDPAFFDACAAIETAALLDRRLQIAWGLAQYEDFGRVPRVKDGVLLAVAGDDPSAYTRGMQRLVRKNRAKYLLCRLSHGRINLRRTETYPPYGQWYRRWPEVRDFVGRILLSERSLDRRLWRRSGIERLLRDLRIGRNVWDALGVILVCEIFLRQFIDGVERPDPSLEPSRYRT